MSKIQTIHTPGKLQNLAINGALDFWQEKVASVTTVNTASGVNGWSADMVRYASGGPSTKNYSTVRSADVPSLADANILAPYSMLYTQITGIPSLAAGDYICPYMYSMEGVDYAQLHNGIATFGFWAKASVIGVYNFALQNATFDRSYVTTFNINAPNTWEFKTITVRMDNSGTWNMTNLVGVTALIGSCVGTTYRTGTTGSWISGNIFGSSSAVNWMATNGATLRIAMLSITKGTQGFGPKGFQRAGISYEEELLLCQRYYEKSYEVNTLPGTPFGVEGGQGFIITFCSTNTLRGSYPYKVPKRTTPTLTGYDHVGTAGRITAYTGSFLSNQTYTFLNPGTMQAYVGNSTVGGIFAEFGIVVDARL